MIAWVAALGLVLAVPAASQEAPREESLAEKAERARKPAPASSPAAPGKVFTNEDLINASGTVNVLPAPSEEPGAESESTPTPEPTEEDRRVRASAALQRQIDDQAETIRIARSVIADWEMELNDLTNYTFGTRRAAIMESIEGARKVIADAQQSIVDLEDQARRQGLRVTLP
jgi:hypothetical protein